MVVSPGFIDVHSHADEGNTAVPPAATADPLARDDKQDIIGNPAAVTLLTPAGGIIGGNMSVVWVRKCASFEEDRRADREFWQTVSPDDRVAVVEDLRRQWAKLKGLDDQGLRRTVHVLQAPER